MSISLQLQLVYLQLFFTSYTSSHMHNNSHHHLPFTTSLPANYQFQHQHFLQQQLSPYQHMHCHSVNRQCIATYNIIHHIDIGQQTLELLLHQYMTQLSASSLSTAAKCWMSPGTNPPPPSPASFQTPGSINISRSIPPPSSVPPHSSGPTALIGQHWRPLH